jgi:UDP-2-acetamido-3-amino-2,3-dideoxy-glucuronate N-acetyltransferase
MQCIHSLEGAENVHYTVASLVTVRLPRFCERRGTLLPVELAQIVPFPVVRLFIVLDVPPGEVRGAHAHKKCHQFFICVSGRITVVASDGLSERNFTLDAGRGLYLPPLIFASEIFNERGSVLGVCCDRSYDAADYIDNISELRSFRERLSDSEIC